MAIYLSIASVKWFNTMLNMAKQLFKVTVLVLVFGFGKAFSFSIASELLNPSASVFLWGCSQALISLLGTLAIAAVLRIIKIIIVVMSSVIVNCGPARARCRFWGSFITWLRLTMFERWSWDKCSLVRSCEAKPCSCLMAGLKVPQYLPQYSAFFSRQQMIINIQMFNSTPSQLQCNAG